MLSGYHFTLAALLGTFFYLVWFRLHVCYYVKNLRAKLCVLFIHVTAYSEDHTYTLYCIIDDLMLGYPLCPNAVCQVIVIYFVEVAYRTLLKLIYAGIFLHTMSMLVAFIKCFPDNALLVLR